MLHHESPDQKGLGTFFVVDGTGLEQHGHAAGGATNTPVGGLLVRGSQRLGMSTGMTAVLWWAVQDENRKRAKAGYHHDGGILPFALRNQVRFVRTWLSPYMTHWGNRCVRAYRESVYTSGKV